MLHEYLLTIRFKEFDTTIRLFHTQLFTKEKMRKMLTTSVQRVIEDRPGVRASGFEVYVEAEMNKQFGFSVRKYHATIYDFESVDLGLSVKTV